jgi:hypothetical protein
MDKITYKDYIGITRHFISDTNVKGMVIKLQFIKPAVSLFDKICRWVQFYTVYTEIVFWCPLKSTLSTGNYGAVGKKSRGIYSNLWYELTDANVKNLMYMDAHATERYNFVNWIRDNKFHKVTNKKLKEYLDKYLPK